MANIIDLQSDDSYSDAAAKIVPQPDSIVFLLGRFDAAIAGQVRSFCARTLAPSALIANALIVDDGSNQGLALQMGDAAQQMYEAPALLGILNTGETSVDQHHDHLLRMPAEWSDAAKSRFLLITELEKDGPAAAKPVITLLIGGCDDDKLTILRCARRNWPIFIVQGAGGLGENILAAQPPANGTPPDPDLREIIDTATITELPLDGDVDDLKRLLLAAIQGPGEVLFAAWAQYDDLDLAAVDKQAIFKKIQIAILSFGMLTTLLAVLTSGNAVAGSVRKWMVQYLSVWLLQSSHRLLRGMLIAAPIITSAMVSYNSRFREGNKWVLLRAAAESLKREIFRYRTRSGDYSGTHCGQTSAQLKLATNVKIITANLSQTEVNKSNLPHRSKEDPLRMRFLRPEDYIAQRIQDQTNYFVTKTDFLYRQLKRLQFGSLLLGGMGTFLAAINCGVWVAVTTALAMAFLTKLELDQVETSLVQYNMALVSLRNIECWWRALSPWEKERSRNIDLLVDQTEKALQLETAGWVQQMQSELDKLTEKQAGSVHTSSPVKVKPTL